MKTSMLLTIVTGLRNLFKVWNQACVAKSILADLGTVIMVLTEKWVGCECVDLAFNHYSIATIVYIYS